MQRLLSSHRLVSQVSRTTSFHPTPTTTSSPFFSNAYYPHFLSNSNPSTRPRVSSLLSWRSSSTHLVRQFISVPQFKGSINALVGLRVLFRGFQSRSLFSRSPQYFHRGRRPWMQRFTTDGVMLGLILANVAVFILWQIADPDFMYKNFTISVDNIRSGRLHTMITSAFSHKDGVHIIYNMIGLYFFGINTGRQFGPEYLLRLYFAGAVVGSIFYLVNNTFLARLLKELRMSNTDPSTDPGLGASGAVNAIMFLSIFMFPKETIYLNFIIPVPAMLLGIFLVGMDVLRIIEGDRQVSGAAHLGGAAVAAYEWVQLRRRRF